MMNDKAVGPRLLPPFVQRLITLEEKIARIEAALSSDMNARLASQGWKDKQSARIAELEATVAKLNEHRQTRAFEMLQVEELLRKK